MPRKRALVVDDAAVMRRLLTAVLQSDPHLEVVGTAADGLEALRQIAAVAPELVVLDLEMPGLDGWQTLQRIRDDHGNLPVFIVTLPTDDSCRIAQRAIAAGASDYVAKPARSPDLATTLERLRQTLLPRIACHGRAPPPQRVLIVDDSRVNRLMLTRMTENFGSTVTGAEDGLAALAAVQAAAFDLIFMDVEMPRLDGYAATREIRALQAAGRLPVATIIGITGNTHAQARDACLAAGMDDLMFKPFHPNFVRLMLTRLLLTPPDPVPCHA